MPWPWWLDAAEEHARRDLTCPDHMQPFARCRRWHLLRSALRDLWRALIE